MNHRKTSLSLPNTLWSVLTCCLALSGPVSFAEEAPAPPVALTPEAVVPEPEMSPEEVAEEERKADLFSKEALESFAQSLGAGAKLHLAEAGYAEIELIDEPTRARGGVVITDLLGNTEKIESYQTSKVVIADFPAATASNLGNQTDVLAAERFQIQLRGESTKFNEAMRIAWLEKHRKTLNRLGDGPGSGLMNWLVPALILMVALLLLGLFWVSRGSAEQKAKVHS